MYTDWKLGEFFLLLSQFLERIAHYSITASIIPMLTSQPLTWNAHNAVVAPFLLNGFCFISSMAGGLLSDTYFRKTTTVIVGYAFYIAYIGFPYVFWNLKLPSLCINRTNADERVVITSELCAEIIIPAIVFSSIGSGLIRSVVASIGTDMVLKKWENPSTFFNLYYWCLNAGSLTAFIVFSLVQQNYSRQWGFLAPTIILIMSFITFLFGGPYYPHIKKPSKSTVAMVFKIYTQAIKKKIIQMKKKFQKKEDITESRENIFERVHTESLFNEDSEVENDYPDSFSSITKETSTAQKSEFDSYTYPKMQSINRSTGALASSSNFVETQSSNNLDNVPFLDRCQIRHGGSFSEDEVQDVRRFTFILVILLFMVPYYLIYFQMESTYNFQGMHMNLAMGKSFNIPSSWLMVVDIILLMFLLPILAKVVYPWLRRKKLYLRHTSKIILGFLFVGMSILAAGCVETHRLHVMWHDNETITQKIDRSNYTAANMTIYWQIPQYVAMGLSEAFAVVAGLELACTQVSGSMQGLANGLFWFASGLGSFCGSGTIEIFNQISFPPYKNCKPSNIDCHLNYYFFALSGLIVVIIALLCLFLCRYRKLEKVEHNQLFMRRVSS